MSWGKVASRKFPLFANCVYPVFENPTTVAIKSYSQVRDVLAENYCPAPHSPEVDAAPLAALAMATLFSTFSL